MIKKFLKSKEETKEKPKSPKITAREYEEIGRAIERLYTHGYLSKRRMVGVALLRGMAYGLGIFIGGTVIVALLAWLLGIFVDDSLVGQIIQDLTRSRQNL